MTVRAERIGDRSRKIADALNDPRPLHAGVARNTIRATKRDLENVLAHLERQLTALRL